MVSVVMLGAPGAGKGTQAAKMSQLYEVPTISTGDILRQAVVDQTELGRKAKEYMDKGQLVPDEVVIGIVEERLKSLDCQKGFILDGFPRTVVQAEELDKALSAMSKRLDVVLEVGVGEEVIIRRLTGRRTCHRCGKIYHLSSDPPREESRCDKCGGELYQRSDDTVETVKNRLEVYQKQTAPLLDYYRQQGLLRTVDGGRPVEEVFGDIREILSGPQGGLSTGGAGPESNGGGRGA